MNARKGDLLIVKRSSSATTLNGATEHYEKIEPMLAVKVTKAGIVTEARSKWGTTFTLPSRFAGQTFVVGAQNLGGKEPSDVFASLPDSFNTLDDARKAVRLAVAS